MSELSEAFVYPVDRSVATAGSKMLDRISVRDYIVDVEIGAFKVEQGIKQKIKVNVVLEILPHNAFESDNVEEGSSAATSSTATSSVVDSTVEGDSTSSLFLDDNVGGKLEEVRASKDNSECSCVIS